MTEQTKVTLPSPAFRTRARVINQLGEQLIKNESIALLELIKNSYDADASHCTVTMTHPTNLTDGKIVIKDNGCGMNDMVLLRAWLEIGTNYKDELLKNKKTELSHKYKRRRLGEKGIGRLGVHRLGREIEIVTRDSGQKEHVLQINWDNINSSEYIEDLPITMFSRKPEIFPEGSGTLITIGRLRVPWTRGMARDCARSITSLNSPFETSGSFRVTFKIPGSEWLDGLLSFSDISEYKLFSFDITMSGNEITDFIYEFTPWQTMKKLKSRKLTISDDAISKLTRMVYKEGVEYKDIDLSKFKIGTVTFKGIIFDRDPRVLDLGVQDKKGLKEYLNSNGGIRVFRDNMRVMDYGEPGNDWLDLGGRRVNIPAKRISNNIILASVHLSRQASTDLQEKANREGFVENEAFYEFVKAVLFAIERVETLRKTDKDILRKHYGPTNASEPVITSIAELKAVVAKNVPHEDTRNKINKYLDRIEEEYEAITTSLIRSAGAGLNLVIVIHQIEKITKEIGVMLLKGAANDKVSSRVKNLADIVEGYSILVKQSDKKLRNLKDLIEQCIFTMNFRLEAHSIKLDAAFRSRTKNLDGLCSEDHVLNALMNLFDNSIWWLGYSKTHNPTIFIDISNQLPGYSSIVIADNGPGFTLPTEEITKPFVTNKPGGMGIGLHLTKQIMESLSGQLIFPEMEIFDIPAKYKKGAKIALAFKKGK
ncbi:MAG: hypothetical protein A2Y13_09470 [Planctomycetes bacterium GWC2_45_44]|nr:MAG: hypothetical protein A2Y13_09470 [Planctomycetes bacterium GWC2_45_44]